MTKRLALRILFALLALTAFAGAGGIVGAPSAQARIIVGFGFDPWWGAPYPYPYYAAPYPYYPPAYPYAQDDYPPGPGYGAAPAAAPASWYWCDNPQGYYPYVQQCSSAWRPVAAQPQQ